VSSRRWPFEGRLPRLFLHGGVWHCVKWPHYGKGSTPRAAWVDYELRRLS
jgi:hypothetical protein